MIGLGTIINVAAIVVGGLLGMLLKNFLPDRVQDTVIKAVGVCVLFIGISGAMQEMLTVSDGAIVSGGGMVTILSFALGSLVGSFLDLEGKIEQFGAWLKKKCGSENDSRFLDGFVTASLTVCIGAMAIVGAIEDGLAGDYSLLASKSLLDFISVMIMSSSMGKGCLFSAIPVAILQGGVTLLARFIQPLMTATALSYLSMTGSILIFCVGVNLMWGHKVKVANMLPTIVFAVIFAFFI